MSEVKINTTYELLNDESIEAGESFDNGFLNENEPMEFRELVDLLQYAEPSQSPIVDESTVWFTVYNNNEGSRENIEQGIVENVSFHPCNERAARYMVKAYNWTR